MRKKLTLGLFGFGCVGQGLYHVLEETHGLKAGIKKICVKDRNKKRPLGGELFTFQKEEILNDPEIDVVVELIDDAEAAFQIVKSALQNGKHVVTANKKMLAENLEEIHALQLQYDRSVLYEGAVCGSIPILRNLEEYYDNDLLTGIEGIFNGSTNYILTKVFEEKKSYIEALKQAQDLGFAESNPALDVQGFDPKFKLVIAIAHAFGVWVKPENIINIGIDKISDLDLQFARERGYAVKLIARAIKVDGKIFALVAPQFIEIENPFSSIRHENNAVQVQGAFSDKQLFVGKGAGGYPTGSAVLSDISALTYNYRYEYKKIHQLPVNTLSDDWSIEVFTRFPNGESVSIGDFENFKSGYAANGQHYMVGSIDFQTLKEWSKNENIGIILSPGANFIAGSTSKKTADVAYAVA
jgi:homoserine dehydrogenase